MKVFDLSIFIETEDEMGNVYKYTQDDLMKHYQSSVVSGTDPKLIYVDPASDSKKYKSTVVEKKYSPSSFSAFNEVFDRKGSIKVGDEFIKAFLKKGEDYTSINVAISEIGESFYVSTSEDGVIRYGGGYPVVKEIKNR